MSSPDLSKLVDVTIKIEAAGQRLEEIVQRLQACGLENAETRVRFGIVSGSVSAEQLDALRRIEGVASVREDQPYRAL